MCESHVRSNREIIYCIYFFEMLNMKNDETFEVSFLLATESFYRNSGKRLSPCLHLRLGFAL